TPTDLLAPGLLRRAASRPVHRRPPRYLPLLLERPNQGRSQKCGPGLDPAPRWRHIGEPTSLCTAGDQICRMTLAGFPTATTFAGRSRVTTAPAPTTVFCPILTPGQTITPPPSHTLSPMVMGWAASHLSRRCCGSMGCVGVSSCTFGPICTSAPTVMGAT